MRTDTDPLQRAAVPPEPEPPSAPTLPLLSLAGDGADLLGPLLDVAAARGLVRLVLDVRSDRFEALGFPNPQRGRLPSRLLRTGAEGAGSGQRLLAHLQRLAGLGTGRPQQPQTASFRYEVGGETRDFELVVVPTLRGLQAAIELCPLGVCARSLDSLGFEAGDLARVRALLGAERGLVALVGQPGNGKTTVYRALVHEAAAAGRRTVSVERSVQNWSDEVVVIRPPELDTLPHELWVDAALRLGPAVAGFDDLPGRAACARAVRGAAEGTLVLYSLALPDVPSAARYLDELPLRAGLVPAALQGVIAVRLVREVCPDCRQEVALPIELSAAVATCLEGTDTEGAWCQGLGCPACRHTGTRGLRPLFEVSALEQHERERLLAPGGDLASALAAARGDTIRAQAVRLAARGEIPVRELHRVL
ncbi:MAG: hypothetical protein D6776_04085 [Planctomycetota bacterium]|nr:MAG: hypothetical protein D6776_04085 [Planctomycetota bacterium]